MGKFDFETSGTEQKSRDEPRQKQIQKPPIFRDCYSKDVSRITIESPIQDISDKPEQPYCPQYGPSD